MQSFLNAVFSPDVLGLVLLAAVGVFVFLLIRPREQGVPEEFWLAFMQEHLGSRNPDPRVVSKPDVPKPEGDNQESDDRAPGLAHS